MDTSQFKNRWTCLLLDRQSKLVEADNYNDKLFFGRQATLGMTLKKLVGGPGAVYQQGLVADAVDRARREERSVYFEYESILPDGTGVHVSAFAEYYGGGTVCLSAREVAREDVRRVREAEEVAPGASHAILQSIHDNLPIGLEVYDRHGKLIEINPEEMRVMGIRDKNEVMGADLFDNPNIDEALKERLRAGEDVSFTVNYDFDAVKGYYDTTMSGVHQFEATISAVRDAAGKVDKYLLLSQDVTRSVALEREYKRLYDQTMTILDSLPVGVELYDRDGTVLFMSKTDARIFGADRDAILRSGANVHDNPNMPDSVKQAVRNGVKAHTRFPYSFEKVAEQGYYDTTQAKTIQVECNGQPIFDEEGKYMSYVFIVEDVTEAERAEEALRQSRQKSEMAIQAADIMLWEFDVRSDIFFSDNEPMNGYDREKPIGVDLYVGTVIPEDRDTVREVIVRMRAGEDFTFHVDVRILFPGNPECQYCTINGSPYEKDADGKVIRYVGSRKNNTDLHRKKQLQEKILDNIPLPIHIKDVEDNFRYTFVNQESKRMFGTGVDTSTYDVMAAEDVARIEKSDKEVFITGEPYLGVERVVLKAGRVYDTIVRKSIFEDNGKRLLLSVRWDQSLQNDLQRRAKVLQISMETMNAYTWIYEPEKDRVNFGEGFDKLGRDAGEVNSLMKFVRIIHPDDRQFFIDTIGAVLQGDASQWKLEYRADYVGEGNYLWWETRGVLETTTINDAPYQYLLGMTVNIEGHKQTELTLTRNKEELDSLLRQNELVLNNTNSGLAFIDRDFIVQWENVSLCSASLSYEAYKKGELCYKSAHNRTEPCVNCVMKRAMKSGQMEQIKFNLNNRRTLEVYATPVFEADEVAGVVIRVDDITERERMITELREAKAQAEQSDKLKSAFLANMSHEIRTPLNAIVGFSDLLVNTEEVEDKEEYMRIINNNNELLLKLINDILDLSKIEAGSVELKYEEFDLSAYFNEMTSSMKQRVTSPNVRLFSSNPYPYCRVKLDRNRVAQILTNYVTNAIKYTPKGFIEMGYEKVDDSIRLFVRDTGIGVQDDKKDKVFHRFEKLDEFAQGTGLGLSICKAIAESMGGNVGFESTFGEGSLFWAVLPCEIEMDPAKGPGFVPAEEEVPPMEEEAKSKRKVRKTILVAEDIPSNFMLVSALLRRNYDLLHASNGQEAVEMAKNRHIDLLLMDMKMPVLDGLTATALIRGFDRHVPIVALTAHAFDTDREAALEAGCTDYLVKPLDKAKLIDILEKHCPAE